MQFRRTGIAARRCCQQLFHLIESHKQSTPSLTETGDKRHVADDYNSPYLLQLNSGKVPHIVAAAPSCEPNALKIDDLETKVEQLIQVHADLLQRHRTLLSERENWRRERARLLEKSELSRGKIEAMIVRLKTLEQT